jgi:hypothetical protein
MASQRRNNAGGKPQTFNPEMGMPLGGKWQKYLSKGLIKSVKAEWSAGSFRTVVVMPDGTDKSIVDFLNGLKEAKQADKAKMPELDMIQKFVRKYETRLGKECPNAAKPADATPAAFATAVGALNFEERSLMRMSQKQFAKLQNRPQGRQREAQA